MKRTTFLSFLLFSSWTAIGLGWPASHALAEDLVRQGEYIFKLAGCQACHTDTEHKGALLAGGRALATPFGTFYSPNLTPNPNHGLGKWSEDDFARALHQGKSPAGYAYFPVFPYPSYTHMSRSDIHALWTYLRTIPAVDQINRPHDLPWFFGRIASWFWKLVFFTPSPEIMDTAKITLKERGEYIATALAHCQECHTPRNPFGVLDKHLIYIGTQKGPEDSVVPNITPDRETGIGKWHHKDLIDFLKEGSLPDGDYIGGLMAEVVDNGLKYLTTGDVESLAIYLESLPPVHNVISKKKK